MLTQEQKAANYETFRHIERVRNLLNLVVAELLKRAELHDQSKMVEPEVTLFAELTPRLPDSTYEAADYKENMAKLKTALDHHYANNRHHPEHFKNGINDMNLIDLLEMIVDWKASSERQNNGNIRKSIEINANKFGISPQLTKILETTADFLFNSH